MQGFIRSLIAYVGVAWAGVALAAPEGQAQKASARAHYKDAAAQYSNGNYDKALDHIAQGLAAAPNDSQLLALKARVLFDHGKRLFDQRDYLGTLDAFDEFLKVTQVGRNALTVKNIVKVLSPARTTSFDISVTNGPANVYIEAKTLGVVCERARACSKAWLPGQHKVIVERDGFLPGGGDLDIVKGQTAKLSITLVERPSLLTVRASQPGARITVDGNPYEQPIEVPAGPHQVVVSLEGHRPKQLALEAREGKPVERDIVLDRLPPAVAAPAPAAREAPRGLEGTGGWTRRRKLALAAGGLGAVAAGAGVVLGLQANRLDEDAFALCPSPTTPCASAAEANELNRQARSRALQANLAYGVAGAAAVTAAVLWLTGGRESPVAVSARLGAVSGLDVAVRF